MRKITQWKGIYLFFLLTTSFFAFTQAQQRTCGTNEYMKNLLQDPNFAKDYYER